MAQLRLLAVTQSPADWKLLQELSEQFGWELFWAQSSESALALLGRYRIPIVICDRDLPGEDWRSALKRLSNFGQSISILLASPVSDEYLWREVVQHHGFDVLPRPFQPDRVVKMVNLAASWGGRTYA